MSMMTTRRRRSLSPEFKAQTVELVRTSGKSVAEVCRDLDLTETAVRRWVAQAEIDAGQGDGLTTVEREELSQLRGSHYTSSVYRELLSAQQVRQSVGTPGTGWDNSVAESFFATLKTELIYRHIWPSRRVANSAVFEF